MDTALQTLISWQFMLFSLGLFAAVWLFRTIVEYAIPKSVSSTLWEKLILPIAPCVMGLIVAYFAKNYAYPDGLITVSDRMLFGLVSGMFSGLTYQVVKGTLKSKIQSLSSTASQPQQPTSMMNGGPSYVPENDATNGNKSQ